jgi:cellulose synthase/poly-beta-1,6-N-acetylglucosamine synthase-like glycosyltransferase
VTVERITVVVPACDEQDTVGACLRSIGVAAAACPVPVRTIVVADSCTDGTARIARDAGAEVVNVTFRNVGLVRAAGSAHAVAAAGVDGLWLAHTDADSRVPPDWLCRQWEEACRGADVVAGRVEVDGWQEWPDRLRQVFEHRYRTERHPVHGCNLGVAARAYLLLGGFPLHSVGEDRALVTAAREAGLRVGYPRDLVVRTSGRRCARVTGGGFQLALSLLAETL